VTGRISVQFSAIYAFVIGLIGVLWLAITLNPLSGFLALSGHLFYVFIYTVWLKRSTPQNIVIGGAAGAVPPLVGWAAVTGHLELEAILLFLLVFLWTPPHFWALALNRNEDYKNASIPMLPVVSGERATHIQMLLYALALIPTSLLLVISNSNLGIFSYFTFGFCGFYFAYLNYKLYLLGRKLPNPELDELKTKCAWKIFGFSIAYLFIIFITIVFDTYI
jgi:protoheme IX farnesyltransferase